MTIFYPPSVEVLQKTLNAQLDQGDTSSMTLNNTTNIQNKAGIVVINRIDTSGEEKSASVREYVIFTGTSGSTLTGLTRAVGGSTDQDHSVGSVVEFVWTAKAYDDLLDTLFDSGGNLIAPVSADFIDAITEIASALKTGSDTKLVTGTAGTENYTAKWNADGDLVDGFEVLDEDNMSSNSNTKVATQQSIKQYVDTEIAGIPAAAGAFGAPSELTISAGVITVTGKYHAIDTESDAASDDLATINGGDVGDLLVLQAESAARTVVVKDGTGNLNLSGSDFSLTHTADTIVLIRRTAGNWSELSRSDNLA